MTLKDIARLGKLLAQFLSRFADCFARPAGRALLQVYVRGLLSDVQRKNAEAIALNQNVAPASVLLSVAHDELRYRLFARFSDFERVFRHLGSVVSEVACLLAGLQANRMFIQ